MDAIEGFAMYVYIVTGVVLVVGLSGLYSFMYGVSLEDISTTLKVVCGFALVIGLGVYVRRSKQKEERLARTQEKLEQLKGKR